MIQPAAHRRASIADVARAAGVSVGTVSNVLNRPERVLPGTRERVEAAIEELSFVRNGSARQLRAGTITTVGAIVLDIANPFFTDVARGIEERLDRDDFTLMVASSDDDPEREQRYLRLFEEHGVQGVMVVPATHDIEHLLAVRRRGTGVVLLDRPSSDPTSRPLPSTTSAAASSPRGTSWTRATRASRSSTARTRSGSAPTGTRACSRRWSPPGWIRRPRWWRSP